MHPDYLSDSLDQKRKYLFYIRVAEADEIDGVVVEDFWDWAVSPILPILETLPASGGLETTHDFLFANCTQYKLCSGPSSPVATLDEKANSYASRFCISPPEDTCAPFRTFCPSTVKILDCDVSFINCSEYPEKVLLADGKIARLELLHRGHVPSLAERLDIFRKINEGVLSDTRVERMHGLLRSENGHVHGLLLSYIDVKWHGIHAAAEEEHESLRPKWAGQIRQSIERLHRAGVVWGFADPSNIHVDQNNDAWIVGFGNGYTKDWTPVGLAGTTAGDWHAVEKILGFNYLGNKEYEFHHRCLKLDFPDDISEQPSTKL